MRDEVHAQGDERKQHQRGVEPTEAQAALRVRLVEPVTQRGTQRSALTTLVLTLPLGLVAMLVGLTATMICYVLLNLRYRHLVRSAHVPA